MFKHFLLFLVQQNLSLSCSPLPLTADDPKILVLMSMWGDQPQKQWPIGVVWFATFLVFLGTSYSTKSTYRSAINSFNIIFASLNIKTPFVSARRIPRAQVNLFMALATMASYKAESTVRGAKCAAEDA